MSQGRSNDLEVFACAVDKDREDNDEQWAGKSAVYLFEAMLDTHTRAHTHAAAYKKGTHSIQEFITFVWFSLFYWFFLSIVIYAWLEHRFYALSLSLSLSWSFCFAMAILIETKKSFYRSQRQQYQIQECDKQLPKIHCIYRMEIRTSKCDVIKKPTERKRKTQNLKTNIIIFHWVMVALLLHSLRCRKGIKKNAQLESCVYIRCRKWTKNAWLHGRNTKKEHGLFQRNARLNLFNFNNSFDPSKTNNEFFEAKTQAKDEQRKRWARSCPMKFEK